MGRRYVSADFTNRAVRLVPNQGASRAVNASSKYLFVRKVGSVHNGSLRIAKFLSLPGVLREFGVDMQDILEETEISADLFSDPENLISYPDITRLLAVSARRANCDHIGLLVGKHSDLASLGLTGKVALCAHTAGEGLQNLVDFYSLQNTAASWTLITSGGFTRLIYAVTDSALCDSSHLQLSMMALGFNILRKLCGNGWAPSVVSVACRSPTSLRTCRRFFRAPLQFDSSESSLCFESRWLDRPLPPIDCDVRRRIESDARARRVELQMDLTLSIRHIIRKQLAKGALSMDTVAVQLALHPRTLDRRLRLYGMVFSQLLESVRRDVACQLLTDTTIQIQQISDSLHYTSAANFSTAFRRWTGVTPGAYRREARDQPPSGTANATRSTTTSAVAATVPAPQWQ